MSGQTFSVEESAQKVLSNRCARMVQPTVTEDGQKAPGLKFGHPRVMALFLALTMFQSIWLHTPPVR
jgi:hypothetical protein